MFNGNTAWVFDINLKGGKLVKHVSNTFGNNPLVREICLIVLNNLENCQFNKLLKDKEKQKKEPQFHSMLELTARIVYIL